MNLLSTLIRFTINAHERAVRSVAFSPRGDFFASAGDDNIALVWKWFEDVSPPPPPPSSAPARSRDRRSAAAGPATQTQTPSRFQSHVDTSVDADSIVQEADDADIRAAVSSATFVDPYSDQEVTGEPEYVRTSPRHRMMVAEADDAEELEGEEEEVDEDEEVDSDVDDEWESAPNIPAATRSDQSAQPKVPPPAGKARAASSLEDKVQNALDHILAQMELLTRTLSSFEERLSITEDRTTKLFQMVLDQQPPHSERQ